jgi:hypothetical protein
MRGERMTRGSRKKILVAGLVLSVVAWAVDRSWPADSAAETPAQETGGRLSKPAAASTKADAGPERMQAPQDGTYGPRVPEALAEAKERTRDPFELIPEAFGFQALSARAAESDADAQAPGSATESDELDADEFVAAHQLQATCVRRGQSWAMIDGRWMAGGEELDGYVLQEIKHYQVTFRGGNQSATLALPDNP